MASPKHQVPESLKKQGITLATFRKLLHWGWYDEQGNSLSFDYYKTDERK